MVQAPRATALAFHELERRSERQAASDTNKDAVVLMAAMPLTWLIGYRVKEGKQAAFREYLRSPQFQSLREALRTETGIHISSTLFEVEPSSHQIGDYDAWDIWELPDYAAIDRYVRSTARQRFFQEYLVPFVLGNYKWVTAERAEFPQ